MPELEDAACGKQSLSGASAYVHACRCACPRVDTIDDYPAYSSRGTVNLAAHHQLSPCTWERGPQVRQESPSHPEPHANAHLYSR